MIWGAVTLLVELTVLFLGIAFAVHLLQRRLGPQRLRAWMGGPPVVAALKGIAVGFVTPFCTYSAVPLLVGLRRAGVAPAGYVAFILAAPVLDPVLFGALVLIVGLDVALVYLAVAFASAMTLALVADRVGIERHLRPLPAEVSVPVRVGATDVEPTDVGPTDGSCGADSCSGEWLGLRTEVAPAWVAARRLLRSLGPLLLVGVAIGLAIEAFVSPEMAARFTGGDSLLAIPIASALGTPLYFSTELFVPIANSLSIAGVGVGAIVALTIAGAGANLPEFVILTKLAKPKLISVFFVYVFAVAIAGGYVAEAISA